MQGLRRVGRPGRLGEIVVPRQHLVKAAASHCTQRRARCLSPTTDVAYVRRGLGGVYEIGKRRADTRATVDVARLGTVVFCRDSRLAADGWRSRDRRREGAAADSEGVHGVSGFCSWFSCARGLLVRGAWWESLEWCLSSSLESYQRGEGSATYPRWGMASGDTDRTEIRLRCGEGSSSWGR